MCCLFSTLLYAVRVSSTRNPNPTPPPPPPPPPPPSSLPPSLSLLLPCVPPPFSRINVEIFRLPAQKGTVNTNVADGLYVRMRHSSVSLWWIDVVHTQLSARSPSPPLRVFRTFLSPPNFGSPSSLGSSCQGPHRGSICSYWAMIS